MAKSGKERKAKRRARRQLHHTYEYERDGIDPVEAKQLAAETRAAPEPRDGKLFTGPKSYIHQDIARVKKLMQMGVFTAEQLDGMVMKMGSLVAQGESQAIQIAAMRCVQQQIKLTAQLMGELPLDEETHNHLHVHTDADSVIDELRHLLRDRERPDDDEATVEIDAAPSGESGEVG